VRQSKHFAKVRRRTLKLRQQHPKWGAGRLVSRSIIAMRTHTGAMAPQRTDPTRTAGASPSTPRTTRRCAA
jgi:hypothetical protein